MPVSARNAGLTADPLFVGATRPPMRWGVTYSALLFNLVFTMEVFLLTQKPADAAAVRCRFTASARCCVRATPRFFDLVLLWGRTRLPALLGESASLEGEQLQPAGARSAAPAAGAARQRRPAAAAGR